MEDGMMDVQKRWQVGGVGEEWSGNECSARS